MYLAIGERVHSPTSSDVKAKHWAEIWRKNPLPSMLVARGMVHGSSRNRLERVMGVTDIKMVVNLLSPDNKTGTWNRKWAIECASVLKPWLTSEDGPKGVFLLGRKVIDAMTQDKTIKFLDEYWLDDLPMLCLPHPSGRGRWLNDPDRAEACRKKVANFYRETGTGLKIAK